MSLRARHHKLSSDDGGDEGGAAGHSLNDTPRISGLGTTRAAPGASDTTRRCGKNQSTRCSRLVDYDAVTGEPATTTPGHPNVGRRHEMTFTLKEG